MPQQIPTQMKLELSKLEQNAMIDLYEVDLRDLKDKDGMNGELFRFYQIMCRKTPSFRAEI